MNILIVDDDSVIRQGIKQIIMQQENKIESVLEASDGLHALRILYENEISIAFVDIRMPIIDGIRLLEIAAPLFPKIFFVIISAYGEFGYAQKAMHLGAMDYLLKPINPDDLIALLIHTIQNPTTRATKINAAKIPHYLHAYTHEALRVLLTNGLFIEDIENDLPVGWAQEKWNIAALDINRGCEHYISLFTDLVEKSINELNIKGCWFEGLPTIVLISNESLQIWLDYIDKQLSSKAITYSIGISNLSIGLVNLPQCYSEAKEALQYRLVKDGHIFRFNARLPVECSIEDQKLHLIIPAFKSSLPIRENIESTIEYICKCCKNSPGSFFTLIDRFCLKLASSVSNQGNEANDRLNMDDFFDQLRLSRVRGEIIDQIEHFIAELSHLTALPSVNYYKQVIAQAEQYIKDNLTRDITLEDVAEAVKLSSGHLSRLFHKVTGVNFITYLTDLRLAEGKKLLQTGQYRVYEVADKVGYSGWKHFSRLFRQKYGFSPNEYLGKK